MNAILIGDGEAADAKRRLLERAGAVVVGEDADAPIAIVAVEDDGVAETAVARLRARGILVNAVDRSELCDFTLPAIVDRAPVLVAVGTGGASAGLAKALRQRLEVILPAGLGELAIALADVRTVLREKFPDAGERRRALDAILSEGGAFDPLKSTSHAVGAGLVEALSFPSTSSAQTGHIHLRSGDPDDLTLREARLLGGADRIYHAADVPQSILDRARADAVRIEGEPPEAPADGMTVIVRMA